MLNLDSYKIQNDVAISDYDRFITLDCSYMFYISYFYELVYTLDCSYGVNSPLHLGIYI